MNRTPTPDKAPAAHIQQTRLSQQTRLGQENRRGPLTQGGRVQIKGPKGRFHQIILTHGGELQSNRGGFLHDEVIGRPGGQVIITEEGREFQIIRPLMVDYVMSMPEGVAVVCPKDAGVITHMGDTFPGATVVKAGAGSGALSMVLLNIVGPKGHLISVERRQKFTDIARANVDLQFGATHPAWDLRVGDLTAELATMEEDSVDRVVLDMLAPWENITVITRVLAPGGVLVCYIATVTQLSRLIEKLRDTQCFTDPIVWEDMRREWHVDGLAVRPGYRMVAHTGFPLSTRHLAPGVSPQTRSTRPTKSSEGLRGQWDEEDSWSDTAVGLRTASEKKLRKARRDAQAKAEAWVEGKKKTDR